MTTFLTPKLINPNYKLVPKNIDQLFNGMFMPKYRKLFNEKSTLFDEAVRDEINDEEVALKVVTRYCVNLAANGHIQDAKQLAPRVLFAAEYFLDRGLISKKIWNYVNTGLSSYVLPTKD